MAALSMSGNTTVSRSFDLASSQIEDTVNYVAEYFEFVSRHSAERLLVMTGRAPNLPIAREIVARTMPMAPQQPAPNTNEAASQPPPIPSAESGGSQALALRHLPPSCLTMFHSSALPEIDLRSYLGRVRRYCPCPHECFLALIVYIHRMRHVAEYRRLPFSVDPFSVHRLLIAGITISVKFFSDFFYANQRYARVGGLTASELNSLEIQFLTMTNFDLSISVEELQAVGDALVRRTLPVELFDNGYVIPQSPSNSFLTGGGSSSNMNANNSPAGVVPNTVNAAANNAALQVTQSQQNSAVVSTAAATATTATATVAMATVSETTTVTNGSNTDIEDRNRTATEVINAAAQPSPALRVNTNSNVNNNNNNNNSGNNSMDMDSPTASQVTPGGVNARQHRFPSTPGILNESGTGMYKAAGTPHFEMAENFDGVRNLGKQKQSADGNSNDNNGVAGGMTRFVDTPRGSADAGSISAQLQKIASNHQLSNNQQVNVQYQTQLRHNLSESDIKRNSNGIQSKSAFSQALSKVAQNLPNVFGQQQQQQQQQHPQSQLQHQHQHQHQHQATNPALTAMTSRASHHLSVQAPSSHMSQYEYQPSSTPYASDAAQQYLIASTSASRTPNHPATTATNATATSAQSPISNMTSPYTSHYQQQQSQQQQQQQQQRHYAQHYTQHQTHPATSVGVAMYPNPQVHVPAHSGWHTVLPQGPMNGNGAAGPGGAVAAAMSPPSTMSSFQPGMASAANGRSFA